MSEMRHSGSKDFPAYCWEIDLLGKPSWNQPRWLFFRFWKDGAGMMNLTSGNSGSELRSTFSTNNPLGNTGVGMMT